MQRQLKIVFFLFLLILIGCSNDVDYEISDPEQIKDEFEIEPMRTEINEIDGINVLFQYDKPVPSFDTWNREEEGRTLNSLNGEWQFAFDEENIGVKEQWYAPDFDDQSWQTQSIPSSWDLYDVSGDFTRDPEWNEGTPFMDGYAWYRRSFDVDSEWLDQYVKLNFLGVHYRAWIYVNGTYLEAHESGSTYFSIDISPYLKEGENTIAIRVYRRPDFEDYGVPENQLIENTDPKTIPANPVDYWPYAGITRDVYLEVTDKTTVSKVLTNAKKQQLDMYAVVYNNSDEEVTREIVMHPGEGTGASEQRETINLEPQQVKVVHQHFDIPDAQEWSPATPQLYLGKVQLYEEDNVLGDSLQVDYGMREVRVDGTKLLLNDHDIFLKGLNWHEETGLSGRSMTQAEFDHEFDMIAGMNVNFLRNSHYNRHPYAYEKANEMGIMMMDESENMWMSREAISEQESTYKLSHAMVAMTTWNQINHPSVIIWSLQNESSREGSGLYGYQEWMRALVNITKDLDIQERPTSGAHYGGGDDPANAVVDIIGWNEYFGFFDGYWEDVNDLAPALESIGKTFGKPILITENGSWSELNRFGGWGGTEDWQSNLFRDNYNQAVDMSEYTIGYTYWLYKDYKTRGGYNTRDGFTSTMGTVTFYGEEVGGVLENYKKRVYDTIKDAPNPKPYPEEQ